VLRNVWKFESIYMGAHRSTGIKFETEHLQECERSTKASQRGRPGCRSFACAGKPSGRLLIHGGLRRFTCTRRNPDTSKVLHVCVNSWDASSYTEASGCSHAHAKTPDTSSNNQTKQARQRHGENPATARDGQAADGQADEQQRQKQKTAKRDSQNNGRQQQRKQQYANNSWPSHWGVPMGVPHITCSHCPSLLAPPRQPGHPTTPRPQNQNPPPANYELAAVELAEACCAWLFTEPERAFSLRAATRMFAAQLIHVEQYTKKVWWHLP